jgi:hypothetical protein
VKLEPALQRLDDLVALDRHRVVIVVVEIHLVHLLFQLSEGLFQPLDFFFLVLEFAPR